MLEDSRELIRTSLEPIAQSRAHRAVPPPPKTGTWPFVKLLLAKPIMAVAETPSWGRAFTILPSSHWVKPLRVPSGFASSTDALPLREYSALEGWTAEGTSLASDAKRVPWS